MRGEMTMFGRDKNFIGIEVVARDEADSVLGAQLPGSLLLFI